MFENATPGARLAAAVEAVGVDDLAGLDSDAVLDVVLATERLTRWATARHLAALAEFARRRPEVDGTAAPAGTGWSEFTADEVAPLLGISRLHADHQIALAVALTERLPGAFTALHAGEINLQKARVFLETTEVLDEAATAAVEQRLLPEAEELTPGQLRRRLTRAALAVDPAASAGRHRAARRERRFSLTPQPDGMASLWLLAPAEQLSVAVERVRALADAIVPPDLGLPAGSASADSTSTAVPDDRGVDARRVDVLLDLLTHGSTPAMRAQTAGGDEPPAVRPQVQVVVAATTLLGLDDQPGELAGYGPIPAGVARRLARDGTWQRLLTDPATCRLLEVGRTRYRPGAVLDHHVRTRDRTCRFPGCRQPAHRADLDHTTPWPTEPTSAGNLAVLCRHHHRLKHQAGWQLHRPPEDPDRLEWHSPTGRRYLTRPDPVLGEYIPPAMHPPDEHYAQPVTSDDVVRAGVA